VVAHAAADDQHPLLTQGLQRPASGQMQRRVQRGAKRQLHHWDVGAREHQQHRDKHTVVKATAGILL
jgi:hypothetical protein